MTRNFSDAADWNCFQDICGWHRAQSGDRHSRWWKTTINTCCEWIGRHLQKGLLIYWEKVFDMLGKSSVCWNSPQYVVYLIVRRQWILIESTKDPRSLRCIFSSKILEKHHFRKQAKSLPEIIDFPPQSRSFRSSRPLVESSINSICLTKIRSILLIFGYKLASKCFFHWTFSLYVHLCRDSFDLSTRHL